MDSGAARVDDIKIVGCEVGGADAERAGSVVVAGFVGSFALCNGDLVFGVVLVVGCVAVDCEFAG